MSEVFCSTMVLLYPILWAAAVVNSRAVNLRRRATNGFRRLTSYASVFAILGLIYSIIGMRLGGLEGAAEVIAWVLLAFVMISALWLTSQLIRSALEDDEEAIEYNDNTPGGAGRHVRGAARIRDEDGKPLWPYRDDEDDW